MATTAGTLTLTNSVSTVSSLFSTKFPFTLANNINSGDYLIVEIPSYDNGFILDANTITCKIDDTTNGDTTYPCTAYSLTNWLVIIPSNVITPGSAPKLELINLQWPKYIDSVGKLKLRVINQGTNKETDILESSTNFNSPVAKTFTVFTMSATKTGLGFIDNKFTFEFTAESDIPNNGFVVILFPSEYFLSASVPLPTFSSTVLTSVNSTHLIKALFIVNEVRIYNLGFLAKNTKFTVNLFFFYYYFLVVVFKIIFVKFYFFLLINLKVTISGVKNPQIGVSSNNFFVYTKFANKDNQLKIIDEKLNFATITYSDSFSIGELSITMISFSPRNSGVLADYQINFKISLELPKQSYIYVKFPSKQFASIPSNPECQLIGTITTFESCVLQGSNIILKTDTKIAQNSDIGIKIKNVLNPLPVKKFIYSNFLLYFSFFF